MFRLDRAVRCSRGLDLLIVACRAVCPAHAAPGAVPAAPTANGIGFFGAILAWSAAPSAGAPVTSEWPLHSASLPPLCCSFALLAARVYSPRVVLPWLCGVCCAPSALHDLHSWTRII
jgi:hypothetical protein